MFLNWCSQTLKKIMNRIQDVCEFECENSYNIIFSHLQLKLNTYFNYEYR